MIDRELKSGLKEVLSRIDSMSIDEFEEVLVRNGYTPVRKENAAQSRIKELEIEILGYDAARKEAAARICELGAHVERLREYLQRTYRCARCDVTMAEGKVLLSEIPAQSLEAVRREVETCLAANHDI